MYNTCIILIFILYTGKFEESLGLSSEKSCIAKQIARQSVICVCNSTYCDEVKREIPRQGQYVVYTSSKAGSRFKKTHGTFGIPKNSSKRCINTLNVNPKIKYQKIQGFGGAITDAAGINLKSLPSDMQQSVINSYFSANGIEYNMMRVPIGASDFSTHLYSYNDLPTGDENLSNFTLSREDYEYKIPVIKDCMKASTEPVHVVGSLWAPPKWMIENYKQGGFNRLKQKYMQTLALYYLKFLQWYLKFGIKLWGITTTNEPLNGMLPMAELPHLGWTVPTIQHVARAASKEIKLQGQWIKNNLGPTIRRSKFKDIKIMVGDDQRFSIPMWLNIMITDVPETEKYIDGIAVHYYYDRSTPASLLKEAVKNYPNKFVLATEACEGFESSDDEKVILGSWGRAENYIIDILEDLLNDVVGWMDWNMCLDVNGGPNWVNNNVDSPIIINAKKKEFYKQPMFYALGHVSKFVKRNSYRIKMTNTTVCSNTADNNNINESITEENPPSYDSAAFLTPNNTVVIVVHNRGEEKPIVVKIGDKEAFLQLEASSITTMEFLND